MNIDIIFSWTGDIVFHGRWLKKPFQDSCLGVRCAIAFTDYKKYCV